MSSPPDDPYEDLIGELADPDPWAEQRSAEEVGHRYADELLDHPTAVRRAALYELAMGDPAGFVLAKHGPSKEALDVEEEVHRLRVRDAARLGFNREQSAGVQPPRLVSLTDFLDEPDEEARYRVEGLWPSNGRIVLAAQNKSGKTTLVGNLIRSLADGDPFLGQFEVETAERVILLDNEMSQGQIRHWLRDQGIRKSDAVELIPMRGQLSSFNILDPTIQAEWAERIGPADVLIFDCLRPALDALRLSEDKESGQFLEAMDGLAKLANVSEIVIVHHMGHSNERSRGDSRLEDWPDAKWKLVRDDPDDPNSRSFFKAFGRDVDQPEVRLAYDPTNRHLTVDGGSRGQAKANQLENDVLIFVGDSPGCSQSAIEEAVTGDRILIRRVTKDLIDSGFIRREKVGQKHCHSIARVSEET